MKQLFLEIRNITQATKKEGKEAPHVALVLFDRANRGHQHLLTELALEVATHPQGYHWAKQSGRIGQAERMTTLDRSTHALLTAAAFDPKFNAPDAILDCADDTGFLKQLAIRMCPGRLLGEKDQFAFTADVWNAELQRYFTENYFVDNIKAPTLRECAKLLVAARNAYTSIDPDALPEVQQKLAEKKHKDLLKQRLEGLVQKHFTSEDLKIMRFSGMLGHTI